MKIVVFFISQSEERTGAMEHHVRIASMFGEGRSYLRLHRDVRHSTTVKSVT